MTSVRRITMLSLAGLTLLFAGCEDKDDNKVAKAQACLNVATPANVGVCLAMIEGINTQHANVIRCSGYFLQGGLTTEKITDAFKASKEANKEEKEAMLIQSLSLSNTNDADLAYLYCSRSALPGLSYIAALVRIGTLITVGTGINDLDSAIDACVTDPDPNVCNMTAIGEMAVELSQLYCRGEAADDEICIEIKSAVAHNPNDPRAIAEALLNFIDPNPN